MRETAKLFLDEIIQTMPQYGESIKNNIIGWIGFMDEEEVMFTQELGEPYSCDEYMSLYKDLKTIIDKKIKAVEIASNMNVESITSALQYISEERVSVMIDALVDNFVVQDEHGTMLVPQEDAEIFFSIYDKYYG